LNFDHAELSTTLSQLNTAVLVLNTRLNVVYINSAGENLLQTSAKRVLNIDFNKIIQLPHDFLTRLEQCIKNLRPFALRESIWTIHDQAITIDVLTTPIVRDGQTLKLILEFQTVDRLLKISRDEKSHHSHQANRALIRGLAHEVKNPLGAIRGAAQLLSRCIGSEYDEYTDIIIQEVDRLSKLVDSMLGPRTPLSPQRHNIHEILEHVIQLMQVEIDAQESQNCIAMNRDYDLSLPELSVDRDRLIQAFLNIMTNAKQAIMSQILTVDTNMKPRITIKTQITRQVTLHQRLHRLAIHIIIEDNGPGIPEELMLSLFYPLVSGRADGSGIGLSVAQHVIQQHGGIIECESMPGKTQFHLIIPTEFLVTGVST